MHFIQANLQRSKLATAELVKYAKEKGISIALVQEPYVGAIGSMSNHPGTQIIQCTLNRVKPVKAAIMVFGDKLQVIHDPQIVTETEAAAVLVAGSLKIGVLSVYFEGDKDIEPYLGRTQAAHNKLNTNNIIVGGDVNAWSHWWGSTSENERGAAYSAFLDQMDFHVLNTGDTPTFEFYRRGKLCTSIVDVTACSRPLLGKMEKWKVHQGLIESDHNAITFALRLDRKLESLKPTTTRRYNTKKANWEAFGTHFSDSLVEKNITPETVETLETPDGLDSMVEEYTKAIQEACDKAIPKIGNYKGDARPPWWSPVLDEHKKEVLRKKRKIRNAAPHRRLAVIEEYIAEKERYAKKANEAQTESWKEFCSTQERESMWDGIYRVIRRTVKRQEDTLLRNAQGETLCPEKSAELLASTFYPDDSISTDIPYHTHLREWTERRPEDIEDLSEDDPPFTDAELETVLKALNPKKAPGPDGLTSDICTAAIRHGKKVFMAIVNRCLLMSHFPKLWKIAHVIILRKPGKEDYTQPKSYRPIGLLSILGKIVEKLKVGRLQWHTQTTLSKRQYGFTPQRGTEDALCDLLRHVRSNLQEKKIVLIISLDIEGAFDNAWWPALKHQLALRKCPKNIYALVCSYLQDRKIMVNYARATSQRETTKGCVQGSIGGPTFWNIILDPLLHKLEDEGVYCQAFADDVVLVFSGHTIGWMEESANSTLETIVEWGVQNKLKFAAHKTNAMLLTKKLKYATPLLNMSGSRLNLVTEIKLLGLTIDRNLNFKAHVSANCKKAADIYKQLACAAKVTWGLNSEIVRTIYVAVIEPIVMYAASAWSQATELQMIRDQLDSLQRGFAQKICKAYRTVSLTSALILSGLLPLDLRIQEAASLYAAKKGISTDYIPTGRRLEQRLSAINQPHPSQLITTEYVLLENMNPETLESHKIAGPQVYTDGSKMEGKVGAALTWWEEGRESSYSTFSLDPTCTVFQSELYALHRAVDLAKNSSKELVNILSDSRSSLELLGNPKTIHPLTGKIKESIKEIRADGREVRLFWLRAHVGTAGNERADQLAKQAASETTSTPDYGEVPVSYVKKKIREETVRKWQDRYVSSSTGAVTKVFFPNAAEAYRTVRKIKLTPRHVQAFTGHGGMAEYLHRFKLKDSPGCECDPDTSESNWHILLECPRFALARMDLEFQLNTKLEKSCLNEIIAKNDERPFFLEFVENCIRVASNRNTTLNIQTPTQPTTPPSPPQTQTQSQTPTQTPKTLTQTQNRPSPMSFHLLENAEQGTPGLRIKGVATFMDENSERLGICFCCAMARNTVTISPGLALLLKGSNFKATMRRKVFEALAEVTIANHRCRIVRIKNKVIALFVQGEDVTEYAQACSLLSVFGRKEEDLEVTPRKISVDAMVVAYEKAEARDYIGAVRASQNHEVIVYEDRGQNLRHLRPYRPDLVATAKPVDRWGHPIANPDNLSGSERLQNQRAEEKEKEKIDKNTKNEPKETPLKFMAKVLTDAMQNLLTKKSKVKSAKAQTSGPAKVKPPPKPQDPHTVLTKAQKGLVIPPELSSPETTADHLTNAFTEYKAVLRATLVVKEATCKSIMQNYYKGKEKQLNTELQDSDAAVYDNATSQILRGNMAGQYMAAYNKTRGFVVMNEEKSRLTEKLVFDTPDDDPIVVVAKCTKVMLEERILERAETVSRGVNTGGAIADQATPKINWINGVPGCGKTYWVLNNFIADQDIVTTATTEALRDMREKLTTKFGDAVKSRVRTMASLLVNGPAEGGSCSRVIIDEALMSHFGAVVMAAKLTGATEVLLLGDYNQLPYIDRDNLFAMKYTRPNLATKITKEMLCTRRNPMDVAYALNEIYSGIYSAVKRVRSLSMETYDESRIPKDQPDTLYLVHTQVEKLLLTSLGYGKAEGSQVHTIHEAQGLTFSNVIIIKTTGKTQLHSSVSHSVVAVTRHTGSCVYYTASREGDATAQFIQKALSATTGQIMDYNINMGIRSRDLAVVDVLLEVGGSEKPDQQV